MSQRLQHEEQTQYSPVRPHTTAPPMVEAEPKRLQDVPASVYRKDGDTQLAWWQEETNGPRGQTKTAAIALGLLYTLFAFASPLATLATSIAIHNTRGGLYNINYLFIYALSLAASILPALAAGYGLTRVAPRHAVRGAVVAASVQGALSFSNWGVMAALASLSDSSTRFYGSPVEYFLRPVIAGGFLILAAWLFGLNSATRRARNR